MAIKKSDLYSKLWQSCDELRGGMDASQYKDYVLVLLFIKYVTDKYYGKPNSLLVVPDGGSFHDMVKLKGNSEIGDGMNKIIHNLAEENDLIGVITVADFNNDDKLGKGKEKVDRLTNLISIFESDSLDMSKNSADGDDLLGDAYEYLMRNFATQSGKSKGQFYTPAEVSRVMAKVIGVENSKSRGDTIYDPTCGSGSLLLKAADEAPYGLTIYGQEKDNTTRALAKMNMILHENAIADIRQGDTLSSPEFLKPDGSLETFDFAVANPPFSTKSWRNGLNPENDVYGRFQGFGIPPAKNGDYAFLLHFIHSLKNNKGKGAIILPHGVLFRGNVEAQIRKNIVKRGLIKGIIGLPPNLFFGTGIPASIIVIDKEDADKRNGIFMIDASSGFIKDGNKNRIRERDIHKIVDVFKGQLEIPKYSRFVNIKEIEENDYNLNIPRYIDTQEEEDIQDIGAHLMGGIPNRDIDDLKKYWSVYPNLKDELFSPTKREGYSKLNVETKDIKSTIFSHEDFIKYSNKVKDKLNNWKDKYVPILKDINSNTKPKELIFDISEDLIDAFSDSKLIDKYDVYQHLMNYWLETMKDDIYMISENGWTANEELIPDNLIINRYFKEEKQVIEELEVKRDEITRQKEEFEEEHSGEEGILEEVKNDRGNITKTNLNKRIKEIKDNQDAVDELEILKQYLKLMDTESKAKKKIRDAEKKLQKKVQVKYKELSKAETQDILVNDKWIVSIINEITTEMDRISHRLTTRIKELSERYGETLPEMETEVEELSKKVKSHLQRMGFASIEN
ncbi:MAG: type I restriction-modification system subunit M [Thermoanaerobacteraceae bacterium]|nr:type I restriction-modification system subunit M [Thermoanaerobacteraceae bacterium]